MAEGMERVENLKAKRRWDVWAGFSGRCVAVQLDRGAGDGNFFEL
jgi:hypothetical protein